MHGYELTDPQFEELLSFIREQGQWVKKTRQTFFTAHPGSSFPHELKKENRNDLGTQRESPVTLLDKVMHRVLSDKLATLSTLPIVSEEATPAENCANSRKVKNEAGKPSYWIMDPIDRTSNVIDPKCDGYLIQLGQIVDGKAAEGILYFPEYDLFLYTRRGVAYRREGNGPTTPLSIPKPLALDSGMPLRLSADCYKLPHQFYRDHPSLTAPRGFELVSKRGIQHYPNLPITRLGKRGIPVGEDPRFKDDLLLLLGKVDLASMNSSGFEWDLAPHQALIEAAGGAVIDKYTGEPPRYGGRFTNTDRQEPWSRDRPFPGCGAPVTQVRYPVTEIPLNPTWVGHPATLQYLGLSGYAPERAGTKAGALAQQRTSVDRDRIQR